MNKIEYLLNILGEECAEADQMVHKTLRFGFDEVRSGQPYTNRERLTFEINDICAMIEMLQDEGFKFPNLGNREMIEQKKKNVIKYMEISREQGTLQD